MPWYSIQRKYKRHNIDVMYTLYLKLIINKFCLTERFRVSTGTGIPKLNINRGLQWKHVLFMHWITVQRLLFPDILFKQRNWYKT